MASIYTGLFSISHEHKKLERDLEDSGFSDSDYVVFLNNNGTSQYVASVSVKDQSQTQLASKIFERNRATKTFLFNDAEHKDLYSYPTIKNWMDARSKAEIQETPSLRIKTSSSGIDSEVKF